MNFAGSFFPPVASIKLSAPVSILQSPNQFWTVDVGCWHWPVVLIDVLTNGNTPELI